MQRFRSRKTLQKFGPVLAEVHNQFNQELHLVAWDMYRVKTFRRVGGMARSRSLIDAGFSQAVPHANDLTLL